MRHPIQISLLIVFLPLVAGCGGAKTGADGKTSSSGNQDAGSQPANHNAPAKPRTPAERMGTVFTDFPGSAAGLPRLTAIEVPTFPGSYAIWGATGRDDAGGIWFGVAADGVSTPSAHLFHYDPASGRVVDHGSVVEQLRAAGIARDGESQMKIHSKIIQGDDGYLYFASMDETGEKSDGSRYPKWGGHLWRYKPTAKNWEHLLATREALISVAGTGRWIYALGYFNHVLYQYDTQSGAVKQTAVGSVGGHITRNFLVDLHGHAYVPRVKIDNKANNPTSTSKSNKKQKKSLTSTLVEFDTDLREVQEIELPDYEPTADFDSHGIAGFAFLKTGRLLFSTHTGGLWSITPKDGPAEIRRLGSFHPDGRSYPSVLFSPDGGQFLAGITKRRKHGYEWIVYDLKTGIATASLIPETAQPLLKRNDLLLYGSNTRDNDGNAYAVGRWREGKTRQPVLLKLTLSR